ncbi:hypothetical protein CEE45_01025 [Candidatus Heimdallarchaeota archaeon B3_Heim]|nr:MAG: hypothetical protein CEE45_01025 [Candidatus Heimdallarchaeota archaeon B3_Heim]
MATNQSAAYFFRVIYMVLFIFSGFLVISSIDSAMFDFAKVFEILNYVMLIVQGIVSAMGEIAKLITNYILSVKASIPYLGNIIGDPSLGTLNIVDIEQTLASIFNPDNGFYPHSTIDLAEVDIIQEFSIFFGATTILILLPIAFFSGIGFLREGDTKLAIYSFLGFQMILIVAIFTQNIKISTQIDTSSLFSMIISPIFTLGFLLYLLLEVAFQTSYTLNIIEPMSEREKRIQGHLKRIRTFVPIEEGAKSTDQSIQSMQSSKHGLLAASYLREMVERRVFKRGETVRDSKSMMRLQSYLANLQQSDPRVDLKLAAQTAQPDASSLIKYFIPAMIFRIIAVVVLAYFIMAPEGVLNLEILGIKLFIFPALVDSLEISQPEFQTILILNMVLILILVGVILKYLTSGKTRKVMERVVQRIDTLVDFDRSTPQPTASSEPSEEDSILDEEEEELLDTEEEEQT